MMYSTFDMHTRAADRGERLRRQAATYRLLRGATRRRSDRNRRHAEADITISSA